MSAIVIENEESFTQDEIRKVFAFFLKAKKINKKFRSARYGYRTYDNAWKIFKDKSQIVRHRMVEVLRNGEYEKVLEEKVYQLVRLPKSIDVKFIAQRLV